MLEYIIIGLLVIVIIFLVLVLLKIKSVNERDITLTLSKIETDIVKEIGDFKLDFSRVLTSDFNSLNDKIEEKLKEINISFVK